MKAKIILLFIWFGVCTGSNTTYGQTEVQFRTLKEFGNDTLAFINANFGPNNYYCSGRDLKQFISELREELPVRSFRLLQAASCKDIFFIDFYYYPVEVITAKAKAGLKVICIQLNLEYPVIVGKELYQEMIKLGMDMDGGLIPWNDKYLGVLNKVKPDYFVANEYYEL